MKTFTLFVFLIGSMFSTMLIAQQQTRIEFEVDEIKLSTGDSIQIKIQLVTDSSTVLIDTPEFVISPDDLGYVRNSMFYATNVGKGWMKAIYQNLTDSIKVEIEEKSTSENPGDDESTEEQPTDSIGVNTIKISRVLPSGKVLPPFAIKEGQKYTIGGLPSPMNILNGGTILFPAGSLKEDVTIHVELPKFSEIGESDSVKFKHKKIVNSIAFHVYVNDSLISPYYFEQPLEIEIPFKRGLLRNLGIDPAKLSLFYASDSLVFDQNGISDVIVDSASNVIKSKVAHFSNLVVAESSVLTSENPLKEKSVSIFPAASGDAITIRFDQVENGQKTIILFNVTGQSIVNRSFDGNELNLSVSDFPTGVYFIRILTDRNEQLNVTRFIKR